MPWKEFSVLEARMQFVLACREKREFFVSLCRRFGISRKRGYKWLKRYRQGGVQAVGDASRRPRFCAKADRTFCRGAFARPRHTRSRAGPNEIRGPRQE